MTNQPDQQEPKKKFKKPLNNYAKYSTMGVEMIVTILLFLWVGKWVDEKLVLQTPIFTAIFSLLGVFASMYRVIKSLNQ